MDGPFMTVLPFGKSNEYLLYAVEGSVVARQTCELLPEEWLNPLTAPLANMDRAAHFEAMISSCARFVPSLSSAKVTGYLEGPRMVLARNDATDARPSLINSYSDRYVTVYSGKVDHSIWVAETVAEILVGTRASTETVVSSV